jgi:hypothetical protein
MDKKNNKGQLLLLVQRELWFFCTALHLTALDHCMKFLWIPTIYFQVMHWTIKSNKGQKTIKWVKKELWFLCTALSLNILDHCMKLYWIPTGSFKVMLWTKKSNGKVTKGNNSIITLNRVMVLVHCTSSYCAWPLYEVVLNSNQYFTSYTPDKEKYQRAINL